jgi:hypothetical protein
MQQKQNQHANQNTNQIKIKTPIKTQTPNRNPKIKTPNQHQNQKHTAKTLEDNASENVLLLKGFPRVALDPRRLGSGFLKTKKKKKRKKEKKEKKPGTWRHDELPAAVPFSCTRRRLEKECLPSPQSPLA